MMDLKESSSTLNPLAVNFDTLKPICCDVMKNPSSEALSKLLQTLKGLSTHSLRSEVTNYVTFPLIVHLKALNRLQSRAKSLLLECLQEILSKSPVENFNFFMELFQNLTMVLTLKESGPTTEFNSNLREDMVRAIEESMFYLLKKMVDPHRNLLFSGPYVKSIGHCIYIQLQVVNADLPLDIRLRALDVIECFHDAAAECDHRRKEMLNFLPGIVISLRKSASSRLGRTRVDLIARSLEVLTKAVLSATSAVSNENLEKVDQNLSTLLTSLSQELIGHDDERLREKLSSLSQQIIGLSNGRLQRCVETLWANILILCWDENSSTSGSCRRFLSSNINRTQICDFENVLRYLRNAKSSFLAGNIHDSVKYLKYASSSFCVNRVLFVELSAAFPLLASTFTVAIVKGEFDLNKSSETSSFSTNQLRNICENLCISMSRAANLEDVVEEIVPFLTFNSSLDFKQRLENNFIGTLFMFNTILKAHLGADSTPLKTVDLADISTLYLEVLDLQILDRVNASPKVLAVLEYECLLLIDGIGVLANADTNCVLPTILYYLLELAGNQESRLICDATLKILSNLATKMQFNSLGEFLSANCDLILTELSVRINSISSYPRCADALVFLAQYFNFSREDFVQLIQHALAQSCDNVYASSQLVFTRIFYAFLQFLWQQHKEKTVKVMSDQDREGHSDSLLSRLLNYQRLLGVEVIPEAVEHVDGSGISEDVDSNNSVYTEEDKTSEAMDDERSLSAELKLVLSICERVLNFLPSQKERSVQIAAMDCLMYGVELLGNEENALLPLAHKIWPNLSSRFGDSDMTVIRKSFELLVILCRCTKSFLRKRVVQEVFPKLSNVLVALAHESEKVPPRNMLYYTYTQTFKVQLGILKGLADLCLSVELSEEEVDQVVSSCLLYLKPQQHKYLRDAAIRVVETLSSNEHISNVIWMKLVASRLRDPPASVVAEEFLPVPKFDDD